MLVHGKSHAHQKKWNSWAYLKCFYLPQKVVCSNCSPRMRLLGLNLPIFSVVREDKGRVWSHQKDSRTWIASLEFGCQVTSCTTIKSEPSVHWLFPPESLPEPRLTLIAKTFSALGKPRPWQHIFWTSFVAGEGMKTSLWYSCFWSRRVSVTGCGGIQY